MENGIPINQMEYEATYRVETAFGWQREEDTSPNVQIYVHHWHCPKLAMHQIAIKVSAYRQWYQHQDVTDRVRCFKTYGLQTQNIDKANSLAFRKFVECVGWAYECENWFKEAILHLGKNELPDAMEVINDIVDEIIRQDGRSEDDTQREWLGSRLLGWFYRYISDEYLFGAEEGDPLEW